jgi:hypothetical protein
MLMRSCTGKTFLYQTYVKHPSDQSRIVQLDTGWSVKLLELVNFYPRHPQQPKNRSHLHSNAAVGLW